MVDPIWRLCSDNISWRLVGEEIVVLNLRESAYLSINGSGRIIWDALHHGASVHSLMATVTDHFDVSEDVARADIERFLADLFDRGFAAPYTVG